MTLKELEIINKAIHCGPFKKWLSWLCIDCKVFPVWKLSDSSPVTRITNALKSTAWQNKWSMWRVALKLLPSLDLLKTIKIPLCWAKTLLRSTFLKAEEILFNKLNMERHFLKCRESCFKWIKTTLFAAPLVKLQTLPNCFLWKVVLSGIWQIYSSMIPLNFSEINSLLHRFPLIHFSDLEQSYFLLFSRAPHCVSKWWNLCKIAPALLCTLVVPPSTMLYSLIIEHHRTCCKFLHFLAFFNLPIRLQD